MLNRLSEGAPRLQPVPEESSRLVREHYRPSCNLPDSLALQKPHARGFLCDLSFEIGDQALSREAGQASFPCSARKMWREDCGDARCISVQNSSCTSALRVSTPYLSRVDRLVSAWRALQCRCLAVRVFLRRSLADHQREQVLRARHPGVRSRASRGSK